MSTCQIIIKILILIIIILIMIIFRRVKMSTCHMRRRGSSARLQKRKTSREFTISGSENRSSASYQLQWYLQESAKETTSTDGPTCPRIFSCWTQVDPTLSTGAQVSHGGWKIPTMKIMIMMHMMIMMII